LCAGTYRGPKLLFIRKTPHISIKRVFSQREVASEETMRLRTELIRKIAVIQLKGRQDLIADLEKKTLPLIKTAARHRNKIVHGFWGVSDDHPDSLILLSDESPLVYNESDFHETIQHIEAALIAVRKFHEDGAAHLGGK